MASTYTVNIGIEKPGTGDQSGTWGTTTNTNFDIIDQATNGVATVTLAAAGTSGSPNTLLINNGALSDGRNRFIEFNDGADLGATAYVQLDPNDAEKVVHIRNSLSASRSLILFQGTYNASNDFEVPNGADVLVKFDGGGASATVTDVNANLTPTKLTTSDADINGGNIDGTVIGASSTAAGSFTTLQADTSLNVDGTVTADGLTVDGNATINDIFPYILLNESDTTDLNTRLSVGSGFFNLNTLDDAYTVAKQRFRLDNATGDISFYDNTGTNTSFVYDASSALIVNEDSRDFDFRVESNGNTHMLFVDGGQNAVNIGTSTAQGGSLNIGGNASLSGNPGSGRYVALLGETAAYTGTLNLQAGGGSSGYGGSLVMYGHSHASKPGSVVAGISSGSGGSFRVEDAANGSGTEVLAVLSNAFIFNDTSQDRDFRVESNGNTHMLFVDGGNNAVGIGASTVTKAKLNIRNDGVDGSYENVLAFQYSGNANENNIIGSTVSSSATLSGIYFGISDGGGASTTKNMLEVTRGAIVVNNNSVDADFRVESNNDTHALFVDAGNSRVGVNNSTPDVDLHVLTQGSSGEDGVLKIGGSAASLGLELEFDQSGSTTSTITANPTYTSAGQKLILRTDGDLNTEQFVLYGDGNIVVNENSRDADFRVESNGADHMLFVDGGKNVIGINTSTTYDHQQGAAIDLSYDGTIWSGTNYWAGGLRTGVTFYSQTSGDRYKLSSRPATQIHHNSQGSRIDFNVAAGGTAGDVISWQNVAEFSQAEAVFNEGSVDQDFRVESDNLSHALFVQGSDGNVGIGNSNPSTLGNLTADNLVVGTTGGDNGMTIVSGGAGTGRVAFADSGDTLAGRIVYDHNGDYMSFGTAGAGEHMRIDSSGRLIVGTDWSDQTIGNTNLVTQDNTEANFVIETNNNGGSNFAGIRLHKSRGTGSSPTVVSNGDTLSTISSYGYDGSGYYYASTITTKVDGTPTTGIVPGKLTFNIRGATASNDILVLRNSEVSINETGADTDFRVESDTNSTAIFVDAGNNAVGFFTNNPAGGGFGSSGIVQQKVDQDAPTRFLVKNDNAGSSASAEVVMNAAGNSWVLGCGSSAKNSNSFTMALDGTAATPTLKLTLTTAGNLTAVGTIGGEGSYTNTTGSAANVHILSSGVLVRSTSSLRYKNTINDATHGLTELLALRPVTYKGNNDGDTIFGGLIAEEVHDAGLTEFVQYNDDGQPDALAYGNMVSLCIKAIQEQQTTITALEARIAALEAN